VVTKKKASTLAFTRTVHNTKSDRLALY
jgi:hypothetical protein